MDGEQRLMMEDAAEDKFPEGLRVLAVDNDCVCLMELDALLRRCKYNPTIVMDAKTALKMLRAGKEKFDLVITDVSMPDMDGFKLLEIIGLEMDLPVIMLSADSDKKSVMKGINHGACDYLVKPVHTNELKNIWQHVESRRYSEAISHVSGDDDDQGVQPGTAAKSIDGDDTDENRESTHTCTTQKKLRVAWTIELHKKFIEAINQIGLDRASPKKILELMNVGHLTRHHISSHLQKYKLYLKRVNSSPLGGAYERWNSSMNNLESFMHNHEHGRMGVSSGGIASWSPNHFGAEGHFGQHTNTQSSLCTVSLIHGGRRPGYLVPQTPNVRRFSGFADAPVNLHNRILNGIRTSGGGRPAQTNEYQVQPLESIFQYHTHMNAPSTRVVESTGNLHRGGTSLVPSQVNIPRINQLASYAMPSRPMLLQNQMSPLISNTTSVAGFNEQIVPLNIPINPSSIGMLNADISAPMAPPQFVNGESITTLVSGFSEQMAQFSIASNMGSDGMMLNGNSAPPVGRTSMEVTDMVNYARNSSTLSNHRTVGFGTMTHMHDAGDAASILHVQEGTIDQQALSDRLNGINALSSGDISNLINDDFIGEDATWMDNDTYVG
ncbi:two-component response regulator ORR24-like [Hordeum vulgare subsp. vulgare]|uniref:Two-component response regulator n=1 Tax=Hordeum vulgare subsp. vulgare TaxID=112509 RepID=A0A8I7BK22_HORVV|nr:two-component response regulator ORR24-like [Hordeum vulgare subsp. vulgare]